MAISKMKNQHLSGDRDISTEFCKSKSDLDEGRKAVLTRGQVKSRFELEVGPVEGTRVL